MIERFTALKGKFNSLKSLLKYGYPIFPHTIGIETSTHCNRTCSYCANSTKPFGSQVYMSDVVYTCILKRLQEMDWSGSIGFVFLNEPLLDKNIGVKLSIAKAKLPKAKLLLYSNADCLTIDKMQELVDCGLHKIFVTDHPIESDKRERWRQNFSKIHVAFPEHIVFRGIIEYEPWLIKHAGYSKETHSKKKKRCFAIPTTFQILYNGDVNLCCVDASRKHIQGNVVKTPILDIWHNSMMLRERNSAAKGKPILQECVDCLSGS